MSEVRLNIQDATRAINGTIHSSAVDSIVAALSASPTTIEELQNAMARFVKPTDKTRPFAFFKDGVDENPHDAGIAFVDLVARVVASESSYSIPKIQGTIFYHDGKRLTNIRILYYVPDDWLLLNSVSEYKCICALRREQNAATLPIDTRTILYGAVSDYIVKKCLAAREAGLKNPIAEIHARWLMTPRDDLRCRSPRAVMLQHREFLDADLQSREDQWSRLGEPAPCLNPESAAYRFAGFGTHEIVMYYDLVRFLISNCWERVNAIPVAFIPDEIARLQRLQSEWLERPQEDCENKSAAFIIECERKRLPLAVSFDEALLDDDCPLCRAMAGNASPTFCHFDGSHMDDDFPFSFFLTREEWEEERQFEDELPENAAREDQGKKILYQ